MLIDFLAEYFAAIDKHGLYGDQVVKIVTTIGSLYADAACDLELDGMLLAVILVYSLKAVD